MNVPIYQVDSFTGEAFKGNPAGVCLLSHEMDAQWMQAVAEEMNVSETAFLVPSEEAKGSFAIRWFTPTVEVPLCGHATLASAHILWEQGIVEVGSEIRLSCKKGHLNAVRVNGKVRLDFPAAPASPIPVPAGLAEALGVEPISAAENEFPVGLAELDTAATVRDLEPDFARLKNVGCGAWIVTAASDAANFDFVSRFFAPALGIDEDPVTGSAHCALGPFWAARSGKTEFLAHQASRRGGAVGVRVLGDRIHLLGHAVTVLEGRLTQSAISGSSLPEMCSGRMRS